MYWIVDLVDIFKCKHMMNGHYKMFSVFVILIDVQWTSVCLAQSSFTDEDWPGEPFRVQGVGMPRFNPHNHHKPWHDGYVSKDLLFMLWHFILLLLA